MERFLIKLGRFSAWALLVLMILYFISGFGMTKRIIDPVFSRYLHSELLVIPMFVFFVLHIGTATRLALIRWRVFKAAKTGNIYIIIFSLSLLALFFWLYLL